MNRRIESGCSHRSRDQRLPSMLLRRFALVFSALAAIFISQSPDLQNARAGDSDERLTSRSNPKTLEVRPLTVGAEMQTESGQRRRAVLANGVVIYLNDNTRT